MRSYSFFFLFLFGIVSKSQKGVSDKSRKSERINISGSPTSDRCDVVLDYNLITGFTA